jgi:phosphate acetyltransferase
MLRAARIALDLRHADVTLVGSETEIRKVAREEAVDLTGITLRDPKDERFEEEVGDTSLYLAARMAKSGETDGALAGSLSTTGNVIRAALKGIGMAPGIEVVSSMFLMCFPQIDGMREEELVVAFGDCGVVPEPTEQQLADIAISTAETFEKLTGRAPVVGMLSFSTKGSAASDSTRRVLAATEMAKSKKPDLLIDGELQFDAAFVPEVGVRKAPGSAVAGKSNVVIFPNLDAGNIGYKIAERLGMGQALGPVLQGLARPMNDLSRGASVSDIVNMIAITALQAS